MKFGVDTSEMNHHVRRLGHVGLLVAAEVEVRGQGVEDLAAVCKVRPECEDVRIGKVDQIEVEDL